MLARGIRYWLLAWHHEFPHEWRAGIGRPSVATNETLIVPSAQPGGIQRQGPSIENPNPSPRNLSGQRAVLEEMAGRMSNIQAFQLGTNSLNPEVIHHLQLTPEQVAAAEGILRETSKSIEAKMIERAELRRTSDGESYFHIAAMDEADRLRAECEAALTRAVGEERAIMLTELAGESFQLGLFGIYAQELYIEDNIDSDGHESTYLTKKFLHEKM